MKQMKLLTDRCNELYYNISDGDCKKCPLMGDTCDGKEENEEGD